jgi:hypothetical protein
VVVMVVPLRCSWCLAAAVVVLGIASGGDWWRR